MDSRYRPPRAPTCCIRIVSHTPALVHPYTGFQSTFPASCSTCHTSCLLTLLTFVLFPHLIPYTPYLLPVHTLPHPCATVLIYRSLPSLTPSLISDVILILPQCVPTRLCLV